MPFSANLRKTLALGSAWQGTFSSKPFDYDKAQLYLDNLGDIGTYSSTPPPDYWTYQRAISRAPNSAPGPDGLPYSAWRATRDAGIETLRGIDKTLRIGNEPAAGFNNSRMGFLVKGEDDHDSVSVLRDPMCTRPLNMKNTDNKIIASANCIALNPDFTRITHKTQNGFTHCRNFLNNMVDVDSASRIIRCCMIILIVPPRRIFP